MKFARIAKTKPLVVRYCSLSELGPSSAHARQELQIQLHTLGSARDKHAGDYRSDPNSLVLNFQENATVKIVSKSIRWLIAPLALLIVAPLAHAQVTKPVVVVSLPSYEKLMADIDFLGQLAGQPNRSQQIEAMVQVSPKDKDSRVSTKPNPGAAHSWPTAPNLYPWLSCR